MSVLVFLEHHDHAISAGSLGVLTKAAQLDPDVAAVLVGDDQLAPLATEAGRHGAATVYTAVDAFEPAPAAIDREPAVESLVANFAEHTMAARVTERTLRADEGPSLADADV